jgi:hypothetical protein
MKGLRFAIEIAGDSEPVGMFVAGKPEEGFADEARVIQCESPTFHSIYRARKMQDDVIVHDLKCY